MATDPAETSGRCFCVDGLGQRLGPNAGGRLERGGGAVGRLVAGTALGAAGCVCGSWSRMRHQRAEAA